MAKVVFPFRVKYEGHFYAPLDTFEAKDEDVSKLTALGAKVSEMSPNASESTSEKKPSKSTQTKATKPYKIPAATKKEK